jgi:4-hydroxybenzoate polyprenyltransferase
LDNIIGGGIYSVGMMVLTYLLAGRDYSDLIMNYEPFLVIFLGGFVTQAFGAILDIDADKKAGELTSVTKFGINTVIIYSFVLSIFSLFLVTSSRTLMILVITLILLEPSFTLDRVNKSEFMKMHFPLFYIISALSAVIVMTFVGY